MIILRLENVTKLYRTTSEQIIALNQINLNVRKGQFVGILGPSGSGKTTLLQIMGMLEQPTEGKLWIDGKDTSQLSVKEKTTLRHEKISFVFQQYQLLPALTVMENVLLPVMTFKKDKTLIERAEYFIDRVGLSHRRNHPPAKLSGGEQQRLAIARALMNDPEIILADEPTGNLDQETTTKIMDYFKEIHETEKKTIIMVTHNLELTDYMEQTYWMRSGAIVNDLKLKIPE
ncbi:ABC transporter ATP-binding protein [Fervidibacillus halotolerans]|uniref:ABC transporter ATP-binding protein n=1 Tax=Fervidibacillus halotolerans TaxID=2980027 RepID=A0A9E8LZR0_9BACI|nr:ABC transporter ATP-binding protein [Fervidibacillus halotolerans]WAA12546.1 ABC transporter ATP-binding protein [Fervidibacillus halotolerans]